MIKKLLFFRSERGSVRAVRVERREGPTANVCRFTRTLILVRLLVRIQLPSNISLSSITWPYRITVAYRFNLNKTFVSLRRCAHPTLSKGKNKPKTTSAAIALTLFFHNVHSSFFLMANSLIKERVNKLDVWKLWQSTLSEKCKANKSFTDH